MRRPWAFTIPPGFRVSVARLARPCPHLDEDDDGSYTTVSETEGLIALWNELTPKQAWLTFGHELLHAFADAQRLIHNKARRGEL